jgi:hypothetical protein
VSQPTADYQRLEWIERMLADGNTLRLRRLKRGEIEIGIERNGANIFRSNAGDLRRALDCVLAYSGTPKTNP